MTQPSGWYDDPQDPSLLRYWDGVVWCSNVAPRVPPAVEQSNVGMPYGVVPVAARPDGSGAYEAQGFPSAPGGFVSPQQDQWQQDQGQQGGQWPAYGQDPGYAPQQSGWQSRPVPSTPDGVALSGWWKRVLARLIDGIIVFVVSLPLTFVPLKRGVTIFWGILQRSMDNVNAGITTPPPGTNRLSFEMNVKFALVGVIVLLVFLVYEVAFLTLTGATLGKSAVGISVRLRNEPGPPPLLAVLKRTAVKEGGGLLKGVPVLGRILSLFSLLDVLWPLWDDKKQAIHDMVAATNVVVGPQPRRNA